MKSRRVHVMRGICFIGIFLFITYACLVAEENMPESTELALFEEITVVYTPGKKEQLITEAPASTYILTGEDIKLYGGISIYNALRQISGVTVMETTVGQPDISIRGLDEFMSNTTLLLVDGRNLYLPLQGVFFWEGISIQPAEIKQIEVVKGPVASLYGANALSGLINIITKSPGEINGTIVSAKAGMENTYIASFVHGQQLETIGYKVSAGWRNFDSFDNDEVKTELGKANVEIDFDLTDISNLSVSAGIVDGEFPFMANPDPAFLGKNEATIAYVKLDYELGDFSGKFFWNYSDITYETVSLSQNGKINIYEAELKYQLSLWEKHAVTIGGGGRYDVGESNFSVNNKESDETQLNIYVQDDIELTDLLSLIGSVRLDHHSLGDYNFSGRLATVYNFSEDQYIRLSVGNAYRAPTFSEYFVYLEVPGIVTTINRGNEDLDVETIVTGEIGYEGWFVDRKIKVNADAFVSKIDDFIDVAPVGMIPGPVPVIELMFTNLGEAITWGFEPGIEIKFNDVLSGFANYSYQNVDYKNGAYERLTPKHKVNLGFKALIGDKCILTVYGHYVSKAEYSLIALEDTMKIDDYFLLNARLGYRVNDTIEIAVSGSNLLDDKHREAPFGEEIGVRIIGEVTVTF